MTTISINATNTGCRTRTGPTSIYTLAKSNTSRFASE